MTELPADDLVRAVAATGLLDGEEPVLLLCSAGRDSHCLLDVAVRLRGAAGVRVLHVDHGLRDGSAEEAEQMAARCAELGVEIAVRSAGPRPGAGGASGTAGGASGTPGAASGTPGAASGTRGAASGNLHAWAREARARLAREERLRVGALIVATAHTRTDLVETAVGRLATQPGRRALLAMRDRESLDAAAAHEPWLSEATEPSVPSVPSVPSEPTEPSEATEATVPSGPAVPAAGLLVRPLLGLSRDATGAYCRARGITWRDDPTNADPKYARARLRHSVMPVLGTLNPRYEEAIARTLGELAGESAVLDALVDAELRSPSARDPSGEWSIRLERLGELPVPLARLVLRELCERSLGTPVPRAGERLDEVLGLRGAVARSGRAALDVGGGARVEVRGAIVRCVASQGPAAPA